MIIGQTEIYPATSVDNETVYTNPIKLPQNTGETAMLIVSTAGSITVKQEVSYDGKNFYAPVDSTGSSIGDVVTAQTVTTGVWVSFSPVMAKWIRFSILENNVAATTVTLKFVWQENKI